MRFRYLALGLALGTGLACGGKQAQDDSVIVHEKDSAYLQAELAGWQITPHGLSTAHPLGNEQTDIHEVEAPEGTRKFRLFFPQIRMERNYDYLVVQDSRGQEIERITGNHDNYVSRTIRGTGAKLVVTTDRSVQSWGFELGEIRHRGCSKNKPGNLRLSGVSGCTELLDEIRGLAIAEVRRRFSEGHFSGPIGPWRTAMPEATAEASPPAHSETNVQVEGVDEADIVKTDGNNIYTLAGRQLRVFRSWPVEDTALVHSVDIEGWPKEMFLHDGRAVVLSGVAGDMWLPPPGIRPLPALMPIWWNPEAFTKVTVVDFATGAPVVVSETLVAGQYNSARRVGDALRLVMQRQLKWPQIEYYPNNVEWNTREFEEAMDQLEADAVRTVQNRVLADWLPKSFRVINGQRVNVEVNCGDFFVPNGDDELGLTTVATIDLGSSQPAVQETSLLVNSQQLYQSLDNMYLTSQHRWSCWEDQGQEGEFTYIHKLDVSQPERAMYLASGGVVGRVNDQFSLDEYQGNLRVATTVSRWRAETPEERSVSRVFVLGQRALDLFTIGETRDLAPGERIFSARFIEDRGFVVTFRQVDPLFTIDLSDASNPTVIGELKIPGFSTYIHPLDRDHLFTVGNDFEPDGRTRNGVALSIFDVSDLADPRLKHKSVVGTRMGRSEALYDHRAFTMYRQPGQRDPVLAIPFTDYSNVNGGDFWRSFRSVLKVFRVGPGGILELGEIDHADLYQRNDEKRFGWWYRPNVRRGVFVDDYAFAVSDAGIKVSPIADLANTVKTIFAPPQYEDPTPQPELVTEEIKRSAQVEIPDNTPEGISDSLEFERDIEVQTLVVSVNIEHTYRGDLEVVIEHDGIEETLQDRTGGSSDDIVRSFITERFSGLSSRGEWTLRIVDHAGADVGTLLDWSVRATGEEAEGSGERPKIERSFEQTESLEIPDDDGEGVVSSIEVPEALRVERVELSVEIGHTYRGDLVVILEHDGIEYIVHDRTGGSTDDVRVTVDVDDFNGSDSRGTWNLRVSDHYGQDVGTLESWRLTLVGEQLDS